MLKDRRDFVKNISAGALSLAIPKWTFSGKAKKATFADHWKFIGVAVQEPDYEIWGTSAVLDDKEKTHLFATRIPKRYGVVRGWYTHAEIAHYVGDRPEGPFTFSDLVLKGTGKNTWDKYATSNPTIHKAGDDYVLLYIANDNTHRPPFPASQRIGMAVSKNLYGPWKKINEDGLILAPPDNPSYWNYKAGNGVVNPALLQYKGGFLLYFKSRNAKMGLAVSEGLTGPYQQLPFPVTKNAMRIEDGYAFLYGGKICLLTTDNSGIIERGGGILWKSEDGVSFDHHEPGYKLINQYVNPEDIKNPKWHYGPKDEMKFERPQVLMIKGEPAYLYVASGCNIYGRDTTVSYVLKFIG